MKQAHIKKLLPAIYQRSVKPGNPLAAILEIMETMHAPAEAVLDRLAVIFDPYRAPDAFVPYLAGWVDLEVLLDVSPSAGASSTRSLSTGVGRLRELVASAMTLSRWRGTHKGLALFLETATGMKGFVVDEHVRDAGGKEKPFHLRISAPSELARHRALIRRIIDLEKPAYVTYELECGSL